MGARVTRQLINILIIVLVLSFGRQAESSVSIGDRVMAAAPGDRSGDCRQDQLWSGSPVREIPLPSREKVFAAHGSKSIDADLASAFDAALKRELDGKAGASAAVIAADGSFWTGSQGIEPDKSLQVASLTKSVTSVLAHKAISDGYLSLDTKLAEFYPDLPNAELITVDHLLRHQSGLITKDPPRENTIYPPFKDSLAALESSAPSFCPGADAEYSNIGYVLLGKIIEQVSGETYAAYLRDQILIPLELEDTFMPSKGRKDSRVAAAFHEGEALGDFDYYSSTTSAGALASTPLDMAIFWRAVVSGELVSFDERDGMFSPAYDLVSPGGLAYGRGVMAFHIPSRNITAYGHSGASTGFASMMLYFPRDEVIIVAITNDRAQSADDVIAALRDAWIAFRD